MNEEGGDKMHNDEVDAQDIALKWWAYRDENKTGKAVALFEDFLKEIGLSRTVLGLKKD